MIMLVKMINYNNTMSREHPFGAR